MGRTVTWCNLIATKRTSTGQNLTGNGVKRKKPHLLVGPAGELTVLLRTPGWILGTE